MAYFLPVGWVNPPFPSGMERVKVPSTTPVTQVSSFFATCGGCEWMRESGVSSRDQSGDSHLWRGLIL